jgi:hypothetical protein
VDEVLAVSANKGEAGVKGLWARLMAVAQD